MTKLVDVKKDVEKRSPLTVTSGDALIDRYTRRFQTGVLTFDVLMSGGMPMGKFNLLHGAKSSGKTSLSLQIAGQYLKTFSNKSVVWCDMEHSYEHSWALNFLDEGDLRRFHMIDPDYGEQAVDVTCELAGADDAGLIVFDSLAAIVPTAEAEADASDHFVAHQVKLINRLIRKLVPLVSRSVKYGDPKTVLFINQVRANFGAQAFGAQTRQPGGRYLEHIVSTDVKCYRKEVKKLKGVPTLSVHSFTIDKNKLGLPKRSGEFAFYMRPYEGNLPGDFEESKTIITLGKSTGLITKPNKDWIANGEKFSNLQKLLSAVQESKEFRQQLKEAIVGACVEDVNATADDAD